MAAASTICQVSPTGCQARTRLYRDGRLELEGFPVADIRSSSDLDSAPLIAASIFLDALNVFTFFLQLFSRNRD
jgi:hypothetical protein